MMNKTVLELSPQELQRYHPARVLQRRQHQNQQAIEQRKQRAWQIAQEATSMLRREFGTAKVMVFGSLAPAAWFTTWSDIDLAVWGGLRIGSMRPVSALRN
jgi:hypothetical protein